MGQDTDQHPNDMYGDVKPTDIDPERDDAIPAATVVLLRDTDGGVETLMLRKNSKIAFGGMWVFPGGRIDGADYPEDGGLQAAARNAAARETLEEAGLQVDVGAFHWFAHWTPPAVGPQKRFATWFFAARVGEQHEVAIDGGEITDHAWVQPADALRRHREGDIDLVPPTWVTLYHLSRYQPAQGILDHFRENEPKVYATHVGKTGEGVRVAMWRGDAGYESWDADAPGPRHRLVMAKTGFNFEHTDETY